MNLIVKEGLDVIKVEIEKFMTVLHFGQQHHQEWKSLKMQLVNYGFHVIRNYVLIVKHDGIPHT